MVAKANKASNKLMEWWKHLIFPVKRIWLSLSSRLKSHKKKSGGLLKLRDDVQTCEYEDVQVMWEILRRSESEANNSEMELKNNRTFWNVFVWSSSSNNHHHTNSSSSSSTSSSPTSQSLSAADQQP